MQQAGEIIRKTQLLLVVFLQSDERKVSKMHRRKSVQGRGEAPLPRELRKPPLPPSGRGPKAPTRRATGRRRASSQGTGREGRLRERRRRRGATWVGSPRPLP